MSDRLFTKNTQFIKVDGMHSIVVHDTSIVKWDDKLIILDTGGWWTPLTKKKMNQTSRNFNLGFVVYQEGQRWYVVRKMVNEFDWDNPTPFVTQTLSLTRRYDA